MMYNTTVCGFPYMRASIPVPQHQHQHSVHHTTTQTRPVSGTPLPPPAPPSTCSFLRRQPCREFSLHTASFLSLPNDIPQAIALPRHSRSTLLPSYPCQPTSLFNAIVLLRPATCTPNDAAQVLCASTADHSVVKVIEPPPGAAVGARVTVSGTEGEPATPAQVQKKKASVGRFV